jgi:protein-S-isoprenylcysteine O-methyltransferase Ste14
LIYVRSPEILLERLRLAAFCAYLAAWVVFAICAIVSAIPQLRKRTASQGGLKAPIVVGTLLQIGSPLAITCCLSSGPLRPRPLELVGVLALALFAMALFVWALLSAPHKAGPESLVTGGVYAWIRHPIYLAFLAMLLATGLLVSVGPRLAVALVVYLAGSELRIASEEEELAERFPSEYERYRLRTRWRYLPGVR